MKKGSYICEHCKSAPKDGKFKRRYQWKTEKGYLNHTCWLDICKKKQESEKRNEEFKKQQELLRIESHEKFLKNAKYRIGEKLYHVGHTVTKPTHEYRGNRLVHMRYEERRSYWTQEVEICGFEDSSYVVKQRSGMYVIVKEKDLFQNKTDAISERNKREKGYKDACDFASFCR